jgi:hypothetical protein
VNFLFAWPKLVYFWLVFHLARPMLEKVILTMLLERCHQDACGKLPSGWLRKGVIRTLLERCHQDIFLAKVFRWHFSWSILRAPFPGNTARNTVEKHALQENLLQLPSVDMQANPILLPLLLPN